MRNQLYFRKVKIGSCKRPFVKRNIPVTFLSSEELPVEGFPVGLNLCYKKYSTDFVALVSFYTPMRIRKHEIF